MKTKLPLEMLLMFAIATGCAQNSPAPTPVAPLPPRLRTFSSFDTVPDTNALMAPQTIRFQDADLTMVLEGVYEKCPKLKVLITEGGVAWLAHTVWRMDKNFRALRAMVPWLKRSPSEYVFDHVRLSTQPLEEPEDRDQLLHIFDIIQADRTLCFATDFPHWDFDDPSKVLPKKTPDALRRRILYDNAADLYGLS